MANEIPINAVTASPVVTVGAVTVGATAASLVAPTVEAQASSSQGVAKAVPAWKDYLILTKPRVISLLLFTTLTAMVIAHRGWPGWGLFLATGVGFYMAAGAAHTINMILDRDIDGKMPRTADRPLVAGRISVRNAALFALVLGVGSMILLWTQATPLSAWMALSGLAFYVVVYTLVLKRRTWHNIVIGGAAGSFPPLVGWAAVTNDLPLLAWILFAIIFAWTPVHFWALAILIKDDYKEAGVPMLPVVLGEHTTAIQIGAYALVTVAVTLIPLAMHQVGWLYVATVVLLNGLLLRKSYQLFQNPSRPRASSLFHYSMIYLALLFLAMALDASYIHAL